MSEGRELAGVAEMKVVTETVVLTIVTAPAPVDSVQVVEESEAAAAKAAAPEPVVGRVNIAIFEGGDAPSLVSTMPALGGAKPSEAGEGGSWP